MTSSRAVRRAARWIPALCALLVWAGPNGYAQFAVSVQTLTADPQAEVLLDQLQIATHGDGRRVLTGRINGLAANQAVFYVADPSTGTYMTFDIASGIARENPKVVAYMQRLRSRLIREYSRQGRHASPRAGGGDSGVVMMMPIEDPCPCENLCSGAYTGEVKTYDPVIIELTRTRLYSQWSRRTSFSHDNTCVWSKFASKECWAANPSAAGTHWSTVYCAQTGPTGSNGYSSAGLEGRYINWDFGFNDQSTEARQNVNISVQPVLGANWGWGHEDWGESSSLIYGSFGITGSNTCF